MTSTPAASGTGSLLVRAVSGLGTSVVVGAALGAGAWLSDQLPWPYGLLIPANTVGAWLGVAFVLGASARTIPTGALRGLIGLLAAVATYYLLFALFGEGFRAIGAGHAATVWGAVALVAGPIMGAAGSTWRHAAGWRRAFAVAILAAGLVGEGLGFGLPRLLRVEQLPTGSETLLLRIDQLTMDPSAVILVVEVVIGSLLPFVLLRRGERLRGYVATVALTVAAVIAIGPAISLLRDLADTF